MKAASAGLIAYLAANDTTLVADLLTITLANGGIARLTTFDQDITVGGFTYRAGPTIYRRGAWRQTIGLNAESIDVTIYPDPADTIGGAAWLAAATAGAFDGARIALDKVFMATAGDGSLGIVNLFGGRAADVKATRAVLTLTAKPDLELLNAYFPRRLYQAGCIHTLFDSGCALSKAAFTTTATAAAGSTAGSVLATLAQATGYFDMGVLTMMTGALAGLSRPVKTFTNGSPSTVQLLRGLPAAPAVGDQFTIVPGCDKTQATCTAKFANLARFAGFPYVPPPEDAI